MSLGHSLGEGIAGATGVAVDAPAGAGEAAAPAGNVRLEFVRLGMEAVLRLAERLDEATLRQAISGESSIGALVKALNSGDALTEAAERERQDGGRERLERVRLQAVRNKERLLARAGGTLSTAQVAAHLGMTPQGVARRRNAGKLIAVELGKHQYRYPAFQFAAGGGTLPGLEQVLALLAQWSPWARLSFLLTENPWLQGRSPAEALAAGDLEAVSQAALAFGEQGAA